MSNLRFDESSHTYFVDSGDGEIVVPSVSQIIKATTSSDYGDVDPAVLANAARRGTAIHKMIEIYEKTGILDTDELEPYMKAYLEFRLGENITVTDQEVRGYDEELGYAGTLDMLGNVNGVDMLIDIKTTSKLALKKWAIQLVGYARFVPRDVSLGILHLTKDKCKLHVIGEDDRAVAEAVFRSMVQVYDYFERGKLNGNSKKRGS